GADHDAEPGRFDVGSAGVGPGLTGRDHRVLTGGVQLLGLRSWQRVQGAGGDLAGEVHGQPVGLLPVVVQCARGGRAGQRRLPGGGDVTAERVDGAETGDGDTGAGSGHADLRVGWACVDEVRGGRPPRAPGGAQSCAPVMDEAASPTVARILTSSAAMPPAHVSSALTTMVIMEIESMSRSSVKDLSSLTSSVATPVSSLTISARPSRISFSVLAMGFSFGE